MSILSAKDIRFEYPGIGFPILSDFSIDLHEGEITAISGGNGCGKTTLALILAGVLKPSEGKIELSGVDLFSEEGQRLARKKIGFIFQNPENGFLTTSVEREIAFGLENLDIENPVLSNYVEKLLELFGLREVRKEPVENLSGGMMERCAIASAIATEPSVLILDEPDSFLDFRGKTTLWNEIESLKKRGVNVVLITQSRAFSNRADRNIVIQSKNQRISSRPNDLTSNEPVIDQPLNVIELSSVNFSYGKNFALKDIDFYIRTGECVAILGPSGSGKTTLSRIAGGLFKPDKGKITALGRVALSFQFPSRQLFAETVLEDVAFGPKCFGLKNPLEHARSALKKVGIDKSLFDRSPHSLSDGEQRRVGIAGALAIEPTCIFFDEPVATLDSKGKEDFVGLVKELRSDGVGIGLITHNLEIANLCASRCVVLEKGIVFYDGPIEKVVEDKDFRICHGLGFDEDIFKE